MFLFTKGRFQTKHSAARSPLIIILNISTFSYFRAICLWINEFIRIYRFSVLLLLQNIYEIFAYFRAISFRNNNDIKEINIKGVTAFNTKSVPPLFVRWNHLETSNTDWNKAWLYRKYEICMTFEINYFSITSMKRQNLYQLSPSDGIIWKCHHYCIYYQIYDWTYSVWMKWMIALHADFLSETSMGAHLSRKLKTFFKFYFSKYVAIL